MRRRVRRALLCLLCLCFCHVVCIAAVATSPAQPVCAASLAELNAETLASSQAHHKLLYTTTSVSSEDGERARSSKDDEDEYVLGVHEAGGPSACASPRGCPRAAMVWASGTLTFPGLLTPGSFAAEANLTLKLSLCCDYLFRGTVLRNATLYEDFLRTLLQASPLQVLTRTERQAAFPRLRARLLHSAEGKMYSAAGQVNYTANTSHTQRTGSEEHVEDWMRAAAADDAAKHSEGDGDVLVLYTGVLPSEAIERLHEVLTPREVSAPGRSGAQGGGRVWLDRHMADVQLKITNAVLKCKCPHTLLVMPLLRLQRDELPAVEIAGAGTHCASPALLAASQVGHDQGPQLRCIRGPVSAGNDHRKEKDDGAAMQYAVRLGLTPPHLLPGTLVTWHITRNYTTTTTTTMTTDSTDEEEEEEDVILHDSRVVQAQIDSRRGGLVLSEAASPYFLVAPNTPYAIELRVSRGPFLTQVQRAAFLLRQPFPYTAAEYKPHAMPHFGFRRHLQLSEQTIAHARESLLRVEKESEGESGAAQLYRGYWESVPLMRSLAQARQYVRIRDDAWLNTSSSTRVTTTNGGGGRGEEGVYLVLRPGRNVLQYTVHDVDDVCPATILETHVVWAVQSEMRDEAIRTACSERIAMGAVSVRALVQTMREKLDMPLYLAGEAREGNKNEENVTRVKGEGYFHCTRHTPHTLTQNHNTTDTEQQQQHLLVLQLGQHAGKDCLVHPHSDTADIAAALQLVRRGVYGLRWVIELYVRDASLVAAANLDPAYTSVTRLYTSDTHTSVQQDKGNEGHGVVWRVWVYSREQIIVRRLWQPTEVVHVVLPMHLRRWHVEPPTLPAPNIEDNNNENDEGEAKEEEEDEMDVVMGEWEVAAPLQLHSVDERARAELITEDVPNEAQVLPAHSLRFVLHDRGQDLSVRYGLAYRARCPDQTIRYVVHVVAQPAPAIHPSTEVVYTERNCVALHGPRAARKDERVGWDVLPCTGRTALSHMHLLSASEYALQRAAEVNRAALRAEAVGAAAAATSIGELQHRAYALEESEAARYDAEDMQTDHYVSTEEGEGEDEEGSVMYVCDIAPFAQCEVRWAARNDAGIVSKSFVLRRCLPPPPLRFFVHGDNNERALRLSSSSHVVPRITIIETNYTGKHKNKDEDDEEEKDDAESVRGRLWPVLPVVGHEVTWGYSFDHTHDVQVHFEAAFDLVAHAAAHQLPVTSADYNGEENEGEEDGTKEEEEENSKDTARNVSRRSLVWRQAAQERHLVPVTGTQGTHTPHQNTHMPEPQGQQEGEKTDDILLYTSPHTSTSLLRGADLWQPAYLSHTDTAPDRALDAAVNRAAMNITHDPTRRRVTMHGLYDSALYPMNYTVCSAHYENAEDTQGAYDAAEFARRGLCQSRTGRLAVLALTPRGVLGPHALRSQTTSTTSKAFAPYAPPVLAFCAADYRFARHPDLHDVYGYDFRWRCDGRGPIRVERRSATLSILHHHHDDYHRAHEMNNTHVTSYSLSAHGNNASDEYEKDALCELTVYNRFTQTQQTEMFALRRVFPTPSAALRFVLLSPNTPERTREGLGVQTGYNNTTTSDTRNTSTSRPAHPARLRRIVGSSVVLHIDHAQQSHQYRHKKKKKNALQGKLPGWTVSHVVPAAQLAGGTQVMSQSVEFTSLPRHPAALARHNGSSSKEEGVTVLVSGMQVAGLYTLQYVLPDPAEPYICPGRTIRETFEVVRARILTGRELYVCGDTATLRALALPRDLQDDFVARWELHSVQVSSNVTYSFAKDREAFAQVHLSEPTHAQTQLSGLGFGIYTLRWAIYKRNNSNTGNEEDDLTLVDYDTMRVLVLTDNVRTRRLVTLGTSVALHTTSSMSEFSLVPDTVTKNVHRTKDTTSQAELLVQPLYNCTGTCTGAANNTGHNTTTQHAVPSLLTIRHLPLGTTRVRYTLRPAAQLFGPMRGHTCHVLQTLEIERLHAFVEVAAATALDHECDAYSGAGRLTLCLHAGNHTGAHTNTKTKEKRRDASSQIRFIGLDRFEAIAKRDAAALIDTMQQQQQDHEACVLPWWLQADAVWHDVHYVNTHDGGEEAKERKEEEGGERRCVAFAVRAGHYLAPHILRQPLFTLQTNYTIGLSPLPPQQYEEESGHGNSVSHCTHMAGLLSSRLIEGEELFVHANNMKTTIAEVEEHVYGSHRKRAEPVVTYMPLLDPHTLQPLAHRMRPLVGDETHTTTIVTSELDIAEGNASHVLLRLRHTHGGDMYAGYIAHAYRNDTKEDEASAMLAHASASLLLKCAEGGVRGRDVLQYWQAQAEDEHFTGSHTAHAADAGREWRRYVHTVRDAPVRCEVLFHSLDKLLHHVEGNRESAAAHAAALQAVLTAASLSSSSPSYTLPAHVEQYTGTQLYSHTQKDAEDDASLVTLEALERQLRSLQYDLQWTKDHIDVTGLAQEVQQAVSRRRITRRQLQAIQAARQARQGGAGAQITTQGQDYTRGGHEAVASHNEMLPIAATATITTTTASSISSFSQAERVERILQMYYALTGEESIALRLTLPRSPAFAIDRDLTVRPVLHKDVICGTPSPYNATRQPHAEDKELHTGEANAFVEFGRVRIADRDAQVRLRPWQVKQCEVEAGMPTLRLSMQGSRFALHSSHRSEKENEELSSSPDEYTQENKDDDGDDEGEGEVWQRVDAQHVELEEVMPVDTMRNNSLVTTYVVRSSSSTSNNNREEQEGSEIGLRPCLAAMRAGMHIALSGRTHKELYLRLGACPHFAMLANAEYNENQNSTALLERLRRPRYLRVTIHDALARSALPHASLAANHTPHAHVKKEEEEEMAAELRPNGDVRVVVRVMPTLARLHMRVEQTPSLAQGKAKTLPPPSSHVSAGDDDDDNVFYATVQRRPLLLCERDMRRTGLQLGIELVGDRWTDPVGEAAIAEDTNGEENDEDAGNDTTDRAQRTTNDVRVRSPQNIALLNSFSVVEHHSLESMPQLYLRGGGVYRSHFVNYLFTVLLAEPTVHARHRFVRRYNDSFVALILPPDPQGVPRDAAASLVPRGSSHSTAEYSEEEEEDVQDMLRAWLDDGDAQRRPHTPALQRLPTLASASVSGAYKTPRASEAEDGFYSAERAEIPELPAVRRFSKVEEILFAVPGFATECRGCLLADTTFFVAGDLTGVWRTHSENELLGNRMAAFPTRQELIGPLLLPWYASHVVPRVWHYVWACPAAAEHALWDLVRSNWFRLAASEVRVPYVELRVMLYTEKSEAGRVRHGDARLQTLLTSEPLPLTELVRRAAGTHAHKTPLYSSRTSNEGNDNAEQWPVVFTVSEAAAAEAHATLAADVQRYKHSHRAASALFSYHTHNHENQPVGLLGRLGAMQSKGGLVVNASVYMRLCVPLALDDANAGKDYEEEEGVRRSKAVRAMCSTVSITDALLSVESPRKQDIDKSKQQQGKTHAWQRMRGKSTGHDRRAGKGQSHRSTITRWPIALLHHALLATLLFSVLPETGLLCSGSLRLATAEERHLARYMMSGAAFALLCALAVWGRPLWYVAWLTLWVVFVYCSERPGAGLLFLASTVIWRYLS